MVAFAFSTGNDPLLEATEDAIEATRMAIVRSLGHGLAGLRRQRLDQGAYAEHALSIASMVAGMLAAYDLEDAAGAEAPPSTITASVVMTFSIPK